MSILSRIARLFRSDVHYLLDSIEDPHAVLTQALRDMKESIEIEERALNQLQRTMQRLDQERSSLNQRQCELQEQLELCFRNENLELARVVMRAKLKNERLIEQISRNHAHTLRQHEESAQILNHYRDKYVELSEKASLVQKDYAQGSNQAEVSSAASVAISESEVEVALLAERERVRNASAKSAANREEGSR